MTMFCLDIRIIGNTILFDGDSAITVQQVVNRAARELLEVAAAAPEEPPGDRWRCPLCDFECAAGAAAVIMVHQRVHGG